MSSHWTNCIPEMFFSWLCCGSTDLLSQLAHTDAQRCINRGLLETAVKTRPKGIKPGRFGRFQNRVHIRSLWLFQLSSKLRELASAERKMFQPYSFACGAQEETLASYFNFFHFETQRSSWFASPKNNIREAPIFLATSQANKTHAKYAKSGKPRSGFALHSEDYHSPPVNQDLGTIKMISGSKTKRPKKVCFRLVHSGKLPWQWKNTHLKM